MWARLPEGARRQRLAQAVSAMLEQDFAGQVLSFDLGAASVYAVMLAERAHIGHSMAMADAQIAAICLSRDAILATRNTKHFESLDVLTTTISPIEYAVVLNHSPLSTTHLLPNTSPKYPEVIKLLS